MTACLQPIVASSNTSFLACGSHRRSVFRRAPAVGLLLCCAWIALATTAGCRTESLASHATDQAKPPPDAPPELKRLIGEYGVGEPAAGEHAADDGLLTVYEAGGQLFAEGLGLHQMHLRLLAAARFSTDDPTTPRAVSFELNDKGHAAAVEFGAKRLPERDIGREIVARIQSGTQTHLDQLRQAALAAVPPSEPPPKRPAELVALPTIDPSIKLDIRYASSDNFMGFPLYERPAAYMQRPAAEALGRVVRSLARKGYGLLVYDAYRPWFVTKMFWDATPTAGHIYVADPSQGSRHNRGCAVDLTLYDLKSGEPVEMTGRYDEMSRRSFADYVGGTSRQRWYRDLLRTSMESEGFIVYPQEWWHFDFKDWRDYAIGNVTFSQLQGR